MPSASGISKRITSCLESLDTGDHESALIHLFPAVDKTAKKRRPKKSVGVRIKGFVADEERLISMLATRKSITGLKFDGLSFPEVIYRFGKSAILHEGQLDPRLTFNNSGTLQIGAIWNLPASYITAICICTVAAPENRGEQIPQSYTAEVLGRNYDLNDLWGNRAEIRKRVDEFMDQPTGSK